MRPMSYDLIDVFTGRLGLVALPARSPIQDRHPGGSERLSQDGTVIAIKVRNLWRRSRSSRAATDRLGRKPAVVWRILAILPLASMSAPRVLANPGKDFLDVPPDQFDDTMSVNVRVPFFASQWVATRLIAAGQTGAIVTTASAAGQRGSVVAEYGASKAAVINLTRSLGTRLGRHGIRSTPSHRA